MAESSSPQRRKDILQQMTEESKTLRALADKIDLFVECTSFLTTKQEMSSLSKKVHNFNNSVQDMDKTFTEMNNGLYDLSNDTDLVPCKIRTSR